MSAPATPLKQIGNKLSDARRTREASPQVKAAIAAAKAKRAEERRLEATNAADARPIPPPQSGESWLLVDSASDAGHSEAPEEDLQHLGLLPLTAVIAQAKRTSRLNISSRSLTKIPMSVYSELLPTSSIYYPDEARDSSLLESRSTWSDPIEMSTFRASNNEISALDANIAGFVDLDTLDLHQNSLASIPREVGLLNNLVNLSLAGNRLTTFPLPLLALVNLVQLSLAQNELDALWPTDWQPASDEAMRPPPEEVDSDDEPDSSNSSDFWSAFPSAAKPKAAERSSTAFSRLQRLDLSDNRLTTCAVFGDDLLPSSLTLLELSGNRLGKAIPLRGLARLGRLQTLNLANVDLADPLVEFGDTQTSEDCLPMLRQLNIASNSLETLGELERMLAGRHIVYKGLPEEIEKRKFKKGQQAQPDSVEVIVTGNYLRSELARIKALKAAN
ncbi:uncharacterized protein L969DRAFT_85364 [Mixia osmundae IAM 14324]|uniref:uncharacterized protein n=1 Tax=Mixia osmundae (strain CBS 9802 / IAM 14324 / JCM 22182 / KY 12970) TaxID=764103 RepID=UPI0004A5517C|nr:uncharacterized protein L969DRAFT_85364 [Mixia osmundae IAM 14324]KEI41563.1 hypothetical protein L969DRAFT_85364 [Mixia osmundae IAM 14324]